MPARIIEELASRKQEKIATFLTFESVVAVLIGFMPLFMISGTWPIVPRVLACAGGAALGYLMTIETKGLPLYEHLSWSARGLLRFHVQGRRVTPEELPGAAIDPDQDRVIDVRGPVTVIQTLYDTPSATLVNRAKRPARAPVVRLLSTAEDDADPRIVVPTAEDDPDPLVIHATPAAAARL